MGGSAQILLVEDEPGISEVIRAVLDRHDVIRAASGEAAEELLAQGAYDLLITDRRLPGIDGDELLRRARQRHPAMPVILITAFQTAESARNFFRLGGFDYLCKPLDLDELAGVVERALAGKEPILEMELEQPLTDWIELVAPSDKAYLRRFQKFCDLLYETRFDEKTQMHLRLAIEELGKNAVEWGNQGDPQRKLRITYVVFSDQVMFKIEDEGQGFRPDREGQRLKDLLGLQQERKASGKRPGGLGLRLVRKIMDEVEWSERGNVVICIKRLPGR